MTEIQDKIKAIGALDLTAGEKLIALTMALCKTSDTTTLCELTGENRRAVQRARTAYLELCDNGDRRDTCVAEENDSRDKRDTRVATDATDATPVSPPSRAYKESPSEILTTKEDSHPLPPQPVETARVGEEALDYGVFVNCKTVRHSKFAISVDSVIMGTMAAGWSPDQVKQFCVGNALQWALEIENGQPARDVVPQKVVNFLTASIMKAKNRGDCADAVLGKLKPAKPKFGATSAAPTNYHEQERVIADRTKQLLAQALAGSRL